MTMTTRKSDNGNGGAHATDDRVQMPNLDAAIEETGRRTDWLNKNRITALLRLSKIQAASNSWVLLNTGRGATEARTAEAYARMQYGAELGIGPSVSMKDVFIVEGKPSMSAALMAGLVKRSGKYRIEVLESTAAACRIQMSERLDGEWKPCGPVVEWTMAEASKITYGRQKNRLIDKDNWKNYPSDMLYARAISRACRRYCQDVFIGAIYTPEELQDDGLESMPVGEFQPGVSAPPAADSHGDDPAASDESNGERDGDDAPDNRGNGDNGATAPGDGEKPESAAAVNRGSIERLIQSRELDERVVCSEAERRFGAMKGNWRTTPDDQLLSLLHALQEMD